MIVVAEAVLRSVISRMQGSSITVDTEAMLAKAEDVSEAIQRMEMSFQEADWIVSRTAGYWSGQAAELHRRMFTEEKEEIATILSRLKEHPRDLRLMASNYQGVEEKTTAANRGLRNDYI